MKFELQFKTQISMEQLTNFFIITSISIFFNIEIGQSAFLNKRLDATKERPCVYTKPYRFVYKQNAFFSALLKTL